MMFGVELERLCWKTMCQTPSSATRVLVSSLLSSRSMWRCSAWLVNVHS